VRPLSIVIPVYGNWWMTARALRALDRLRGDSPAFETIVVDNASCDETPQGIAAFPWVRYERMEANRNFAGACNAGAKLAEAPLVLFLNNDAYPLDDALRPLVAAFEREETAIAGGALFFEDGVTQCAGFVMLPNAHWHYSCRNLPATLAGVTLARDAPAVSGAAMAVRREWFLSEGGFDETYVNGFEDVDLCMRARERGRTIAYVAQARFAHYEGASAGRYDREADNERRFYRRWAPALAAIPRVARGEVGGISIRTAATIAPLSAAGSRDLEDALNAFGHPTVRGRPDWRRRLDRRFRSGAVLDWFTDADDGSPRVTLERSGEAAVMRVRGAADVAIPWLPCAAYERIAGLPLRRGAAVCATVAVAGFGSLSGDRKRELLDELDALAGREPALRLFVAGQGAEVEALCARFGDRTSSFDPVAGENRPAVEVGCVLHAGATDESAFGNVLLAQCDLPAVVLEGSEPAALFASDVVVPAARGKLAASVVPLIADARARERYARHSAADARRRFSPRRTAIRVVDLLCAARFGFERPAPARSNAPIPV
jgi:GT2 family glycosyltransferase